MNGPLRPPDWQERSGCLDRDRSLFYPDQAANHLVAQAKRICGQCEVSVECLEWALDIDDRWAVLGGTTPRERTKIARFRTCRQCRRRFPYRGTSAIYCDGACKRKANRAQEQARRDAA